jgi:hypothetical protein
MTLIILAVGVFVLLAIAAVILRAACWVFNKMAGGEGSPGSVPPPGSGKAMLMVLVIGVVQYLSGIVLAIIGVITPAMSLLTVQLISTPISFLVAAGMISAILPTSFSRGLGVAACQFVIVILIIIFIVVVVVAVGLSSGNNIRQFLDQLFFTLQQYGGPAF